MIETSILPKSESSDREFDYVIVGSGAGGAPLAARLAEYGHSVLVLEAGPDHRTPPPAPRVPEIIAVPALYSQCAEDPDVSWPFLVKHYEDPSKFPGEEDPKAAKNGEIFYPRATGIGGCTIHNAMITIAGPPSDWDELAWRLNDPSWAADVMRGYFQRVERCEYLPAPVRPRTPWAQVCDAFWWLLGRDTDPAGGHHGFNGWLHTSLADPKLALNDSQLTRILEAAALTSFEAGMENPVRLVKQFLHGQINEALDPNHLRRQTERPEGIVAIPCAIVAHDTKTTLPPGHRSSAAIRLMAASDDLDAKATSAGKPKSLVIATDCLATRVVISCVNGEYVATGVEYLHGKKLYQARAGEKPPADGIKGLAKASKEVILCGGAFNTPQLLMLSGIGPVQDLKKIGVQTPHMIDSPGVGRNLQDRYEVSVVTQMSGTFTVLDGATFKPPVGAVAPDPPLQRWRQDGKGMYASNGAVVGIFKRSRAEMAAPDLFIFGVPMKFEGYTDGFSVVNPKMFDMFTWLILKAHTQNPNGVVQLASNDPRIAPKINFNFFDSDKSPGESPAKNADLEALVDAVRFVREIARNTGKGVLREVFPGTTLATNNRAELRKWIRRDAWGHHACGTCRMGRWTDPMAVTDSRFRVLGPVDRNEPRRPRRPICGLRVVDASIFPNIPGYFLVSNVHVASEKAADVIHQDGASCKKGLPVGGQQP